MTVKRKVIRNTIASAAGYGATSIIAFALLPFLVGHLGASEYGLVGFALALSGSRTLSLAGLGLRASVAKFVAQYASEGSERALRSTITSAAVFLLGIGLVLFILGVLGTNLLLRLIAVPREFVADFRVALTVVFAAYIFELPGGVFAGSLEGFQRYDYLKAVEVARALLYAGLAVAAVLTGRGFLALVIAHVAAGFFQACAWMAYSLKELRRHGGGRGAPLFSWEHFRTSMRMGKYLLSAQASSVLGNYGERVLITVMLTPAFMTAYEILIKLPHFLKSILSIGGAAVMPAASELTARGEELRTRRLFRRGLRFNLLLAYPAVIASTFLASDFLRAWVGVGFVELSPMLQVMLLIYIVMPLGNFGWRILLGANRRTPYISHLQWANTAFKLAVVGLLLKQWGLWAVVLASASVVVTLPISLSIFRDEFSVSLRSIFQDVIMVALAASWPVLPIMAVATLARPLSLWSLLLLLGTWQVLAWLALHRFVMDEADKSVLRAVLPV